MANRLPSCWTCQTTSQHGSRLDTWRVKLLHSLALNVKRTVETVQIWFFTPSCCSFCCLSRLASHISSTGPFHLLTLFPCGEHKQGYDTCSGHQMGCGKPQPPLPSSWQNDSQGPLLTPLVAAALKMLGTTRLEQLKSYCGSLHPQLFPRHNSGVYPVCPDPPQCWHAWKLCCRALLWPERMFHPLLSFCMCRAPGSVGCHALGAQVPDKICVKTICCFLRESEGSEGVCSCWCREKLSRLLSGILDHSRTLIFAVLSKHAPDCIPEFMFHFAWDLGRFTCCQVATLAEWQSPVKQMGLTCISSLCILYKSKELAAT